MNPACTCGYTARDENDLEEHLLAMAELEAEGAHRPRRTR